MSDPIPAHPAGATPRHLASAIAWTAAAKWSAQVFSWLSLFFVVRLLSPYDFGLFGLANTYLGLLTMLSEFGIGTAVVTLRNLTTDQLAQLNTASLLLGVLACALSALVAYPLGSYFRMPELPAMLVVLSITFLISSVRSIPYALLQKDLRFRMLSVVEALQVLLQAVCSVCLAYLGARYWSLVFAALVAASVSTLIIVSQRPCSFRMPTFTSLGAVLSFSWKIVATRLTWYSYSNADFIIAGRYLGAASLGAYTFAWNFATLPIQKITSLVLRVTPVFFAAWSSDISRLRRNLLLLTEVISVITFPIVTGLAVVAHEFIVVVFGKKWESAAVPLQWLALSVLLRAVVTLLPQVLNCLGAVHVGLWNSISGLVLLVPAFYVGRLWGIAGIAAMWTLVYPLCTIPLFWFTFRLLSLSPVSYLNSLQPALAGSAAIAAAVMGLQYSLPAALGIGQRLAIEVAAAVGAYALVFAVLYRDRVRMYLTLFQNMRASR